MSIDDSGSGWNRHPAGFIDERTSIALPLGREAHIRRRYDRKGRLVDYSIVLLEARGQELIRADMAHGTPEIHRHGGDARSTGVPLRTYTEVAQAFDRDYDVVLGYDRSQ